MNKDTSNTVLLNGKNKLIKMFQLLSEKEKKIVRKQDPEDFRGRPGAGWKNLEPDPAQETKPGCFARHRTGLVQNKVRLGPLRKTTPGLESGLGPPWPGLARPAPTPAERRTARRSTPPSRAPPAGGRLKEERKMNNSHMKQVFL